MQEVKLITQSQFPNNLQQKPILSGSTGHPVTMVTYDQVKTHDQMHATNKVATNSNQMLVEDQMQGNRGNNSLLGAP